MIHLEAVIYFEQKIYCHISSQESTDAAYISVAELQHYYSSTKLSALILQLNIPSSLSVCIRKHQEVSITISSPCYWNLEILKSVLIRPAGR